jgi:hypothetical protein
LKLLTFDYLDGIMFNHRSARFKRIVIVSKAGTGAS